MNVGLPKRHKIIARKEGVKMELFKRKESSAHNLLKAVGGVVLAAVAVGLLVSLRDIKRYIKISTM